MATVSVSEPIAMEPDRLWALVGDFGGLTGWLPAISRCNVEGSGVGALRLLGFVGADVYARERQDARDEAGRSYSYSVVATDLPIASYAANVTVTPDGTGSRLTWSSSFAGTPGSDEAALVGMIEQTYRDGVKRLREIAAG